MFLRRKKSNMPEPERALPGRAQSMTLPEKHFLFDVPLDDSPAEGYLYALFGMGCFWGAEKQFWSLPGVYNTAVGYAAGYTPNPTYEEVCSGLTGHNEVVRIIYNPEEITYGELLKVFWQNHNPTQGMRQGNDVGTQYRSGIYTYSEKERVWAEASKQHYERQLMQQGLGRITTEIKPATDFYFAEAYHQQYLAKNPGGYCGLGGTGIECSMPSDEHLSTLGTSDG
ncbi:MAG TPA: peptide-methionine (S)-S-oxide reductase [Gammaproteobacteria bacterium]|nr:peptide-methionine (S)-S-oxide reductase [Gammaproteobacteria bacterium]